MSADKIRRLAEENIFVEVVEKRHLGEGEVCDYSYEKKSEINAALLAYAAMVERCEREIARLPYPPNGEDVHMFKILKRILRGDAGKEER